MSSSKNTPKYMPFLSTLILELLLHLNLAFARHVIKRPPNMIKSNFPKGLHKYTSLNIEDLLGQEILKLFNSNNELTFNLSSTTFTKAKVHEKSSRRIQLSHCQH